MENNNNENKVADAVNEVWNDVKEGTQNVTEKFNEALNDVKDESNTVTEDEIKNGTLMGVLSYLLPFIPFLIEKENKFVIYHAKQGMNLFILAIVFAVLGALFGVIPVLGWFVSTVCSIINIGIIILCVLGIINVCNGKAKELPIVNKFKFIK